jgi:hypothetical protein
MLQLVSISWLISLSHFQVSELWNRDNRSFCFARYHIVSALLIFAGAAIWFAQGEHRFRLFYSPKAHPANGDSPQSPWRETESVVGAGGVPANSLS